MKFSNIKTAALLAVWLLNFGCTKDFDSINTNNNAPEQVPATNLLLSGITGSFFKSLDIVVYDFGGVGYDPMGFWCQHISVQNDPYGLDQYTFSVPIGEVFWKAHYTGPLQDLQTIINNPDNNANLRAAAMTVRAYQFSILTDLWGDVPYSEANQVERIAQPIFDTQESIYKDLTQQLATAASLFDAAAGPLGEGDVLFEGDVLKWEKFANSLRARLLNRYKHLDPQAGQALAALLNDPTAHPVFESNADNAALLPTGELPYQSDIYRLFNSGGGIPVFGPSAALVNTLKNGDDPRLPIFALPNANGEYVGHKNGDPTPNPGDISDLGPFFTTNPQFPRLAMTYGELLFIKAEALNDQQAYLDGIAAAMDLLGTAPTPTSTAAAETAWSANSAEAIATQKWVLLFTNEPEAFSELRRTGYPSAVQETPVSLFPGKGIPRRYAYPPIEEATNSANLGAARSRQRIVAGLDIFGDKMWWAK